jgi:hypothetical protein
LGWFLGWSFLEHPCLIKLNARRWIISGYEIRNIHYITIFQYNFELIYTLPGSTRNASGSCSVMIPPLRTTASQCCDIERVRFGACKLLVTEHRTQLLRSIYKVEFTMTILTQLKPSFILRLHFRSFSQTKHSPIRLTQLTIFITALMKTLSRIS